MTNFNRIAPVYDTLSRIVFGKALLKAKTCFIHKLPEHGTALFIGGGSGLELEKIAALKPGLHIDFIEASEKFISIAKARQRGDLKQVQFIYGTQDNIAAGKQYAAVITFCIVDLFPQKEAEAFCAKIISHLEPGGTWLFTDFMPPKRPVQRLLLKFMYFFFRVMTHIPANRLPDYDKIFRQVNMEPETKQLFYGRMICAKVLRKKE